MPIFKRGREEAAPGPEWAHPMSRDETDAFLDAVRQELERRGLRHELGEGFVRLDRGGEWGEMGLTNLAQFCHLSGRDEWPQAIATHFDNLFAAEAEEAEFQELIGDFEAIRSLLKVRLYPSETFGGMGPKRPAGWELAPGLTSVFVFDLPTTVRTASSDNVAQWGKSQDDLVSVALANVRSDPVESKPMADGPSAPIACFADHFFAASHALLLGERLPPEANRMAVFAVPHRHALLYAPLVDMDVVSSIQRVILTAISLFQEGPGSISPALYWWRDGAVSVLPTETDGRDVRFFPPDDFVQVLNALPSP